MIKQSIVQEKLNDLNSQMPQWSRVQLGKHLTTNLKRNNKINLLSNFSNNAQNLNDDQVQSASYYPISTDINITDISNVHANSMDPTQRLKYLEKSIKFIQEQHNETLTCLHNEIEKLKIENRDLHFKLVSNPSSNEKNYFNDKLIKNSDANNNNQSTITNNNAAASNKDSILERKFNKVLSETANEQNLDKRLTDIKSQYENQKYEELVTRLKDAENKNEYLNTIIVQLQDKRNANSAYRPNGSANGDLRSRSYSNLTKLDLNHIFSIEPLKISVAENESPRAPNLDECEVLIRKLYDLYKQQKQQISNMKAVLKDMLHTENLSNQGMMMTRDVLENSNRFNQYLLENNLKKFKLKKLTVKPSRKITSKTKPDANIILSIYKFNTSGSLKDIVQPVIMQHPPQHTPNSTNRPSNSKYNQHLFGISHVNGIFLPQYDSSGTVSNTSTIHLPPLHSSNASNKFTERQRRTQVLQRQRLKKEYFH